MISPDGRHQPGERITSRREKEQWLEDLDRARNVQIPDGEQTLSGGAGSPPAGPGWFLAQITDVSQTTDGPVYSWRRVDRDGDTGEAIVDELGLEGDPTDLPAYEIGNDRAVNFGGNYPVRMWRSRYGLWMEFDGKPIVNDVKVKPLDTVDFTATEADDLFTATAHGMTDGDQVILFAPAAPDDLPTGVSADTVYYVVNSTTDDFQLAATDGGTAIDITTDGSGTYVRTFGGKLHYPGKLLSYDGGTGTFSEVEDVWLFELNGNDLKKDDVLHGRLEWFGGLSGQDGRSVYSLQRICCASDSNNGGGGGGGVTPCCLGIDDNATSLTATFTQNITGTITLNRASGAGRYADYGTCNTISTYVWEWTGDKATQGGNHLVSAYLTCCTNNSSTQISLVCNFNDSSGNPVPSFYNGVYYYYDWVLGVSNTNNACTEFMGDLTALQSGVYLNEPTDIEFTIA